jgi:2-polyprenyl-3-methyl-5-hydroxy-6-metoxy-1,4-benzoquinol methylase
MDRLIRRFDCVADGDLMLCEHRGVAYQRDMTKGRKVYDATYLANYDAYARGPIAEALNDGRVAMLLRHASGASVLDIGAATGAFVRRAREAGFRTQGFDVIPEAVERLKAAGCYGERVEEFDAVTCWDSLEHMEDPGACVSRVKKGGIVLAAFPVFHDVKRIRESKHYKPGEHLYYWSDVGFVSCMELYGFRVLERSTHETDAGRESIAAFAFCRDLPDYQDHVEAYKEMHETRHYGDSATELHLDMVAELVRKLQPKSILDYGCGRSDLVAHFWLDGGRRIERYDPGIRKFRRLSSHGFDLVLCCDVMEHIPMAGVDKVLAEVRSKSGRALFTISTKLARAKLPDGRNAHVTILTHHEWLRWIKSYFGSLRVLQESTAEQLIVLAGVAECDKIAA